LWRPLQRPAPTQHRKDCQLCLEFRSRAQFA
jgi:hypothetical protein